MKRCWLALSLFGAIAGCGDVPPIGCKWEAYGTYSPPEDNECTRYFTTFGGDSCVRRADSDDDCSCSNELVVRQGEQVVWMFNYYANHGGIGLEWERVDCPAS